MLGCNIEAMPFTSFTDDGLEIDGTIELVARSDLRVVDSRASPASVFADVSTSAPDELFFVFRGTGYRMASWQFLP